ncbi:MAG: ABC transporter substrate-binding protein [Cyanobacteria bacterium P01_H01_bin.74]
MSVKFANCHIKHRQLIGLKRKPDITKAKSLLCLTMSFFLMGPVLFTGCKPPSNPKASEQLNFSPSGGKSIETVTDKSRPDFNTVLVDGIEMLEARGEVGQFGGTFYENQIGDGPKTFNLLASTDATSSKVGGMLFSGLVSTDAYSGNVYPLMAKTVTVSSDKKTYTVTLRKGLRWSDNKPVTANDVVFTWNRIIKAGLGNASFRDTVLVDGKFPTVRKVDDLTIVFETDKPFAPFLRNLSSPIYPKHIVSSVVDKGNAAFSAFWGVQTAAKNPEAFVGCGMWVLEKYIPRQTVVFKRNPHFFMVDQNKDRLPYLDRYKISFVGDSNNQALQFEQGQSDIYSVPGNFVSRIRKLEKPAFNLYNLGPTSGTTFLAFNLSQRVTEKGVPFVPQPQSSWFNDVNFRQAINHAVHRQDIVDTILKGIGKPLYTAESLSSLYLNQGLAKGFEADLNESKALLQKSGFSWDSDGKLIDKNNVHVEFTLLTNSGNTEREAVGVSLQQDLAALGMTVNFKPIDFNVLIGKLNEGQWQTMIMGLTGSKIEPHGGANVWRSDGALHLFNQRDTSSQKTDEKMQTHLPWENQLDDLIARGAETFEIEERRNIYNKMQAIIYNQVPLIYLYSPINIIAVKSRIQNFDPTPLETVHNLEEIWIKKQSKNK